MRTLTSPGRYIDLFADTHAYGSKDCLGSSRNVVESILKSFGQCTGLGFRVPIDLSLLAVEQTPELIPVTRQILDRRSLPAGVRLGFELAQIYREVGAIFRHILFVDLIAISDEVPARVRPEIKHPLIHLLNDRRCFEVNR